MAHNVGIATSSGSVEATVFTLPGCRTAAASEEAVLELLPIVIAEFSWWLARHGEPSTDDGAFEIVERVDVAASIAADGEFTFAWDRQPASSEDIETALRWMAYARNDLLNLTDLLPAAILDWRPPDSALARVDPWKPHALTIREIVAEIVNAEGYYRSGISDDPASASATAPPDPAREHERTEAHLRALNDVQRARLYRVRRDWQPEGAAEEWTVRKALRRTISHERFHISEIEQRLAWLLVGVPELRADSRSPDRRS